jgi:hypothetical protein
MSKYDSEYWKTMQQNNGVAPVEIDEGRFWDLLEVLPPANWTRRNDSESFMLIECQTANLYTWCARVGDKYFEMIAPNDCKHSDILRIIAMNTQEQTT